MNTETEKQRLIEMVKENADITTCVALYLDLYEDTDVMHVNVVENEIWELRKWGSPEEQEQGLRLYRMLKANPTCVYFDYYQEKPIDHEWLKSRLGIAFAEENEHLDLTADELAYERYKRGEYSYEDYVFVCEQEETEPLPRIG